MKRLWLKILFLVFIIWAGVSLYFFSQHYVTFLDYETNVQTDVQDTKVVIERITLRNFKQRDGYLKKRMSVYGIVAALPRLAQIPYLYISNFYSRPYEFNNIQTIKVKGKFISDKFRNQAPDEIFKSIGIGVINETGVDYIRSSRGRHENDSNIVTFEFEGDMFPYKESDKQITIIIKDKESNTDKEFKLQPQFIKVSYFDMAYTGK